MKTLAYFILFTALLFTTGAASGQNMARPSGCSDPLILHQADSVKHEFLQQGFIVVKEASMTMESEFEMPVIVPLTESILYQFVFIGDASSTSYQVKMFDWDEKQVAEYKQQFGDAEGNIVSYSYMPKTSEYHMIKPVQVNPGKKNPCGYVLLLKKVKS